MDATRVEAVRYVERAEGNHESQRDRINISKNVFQIHGVTQRVARYYGKAEKRADDGFFREFAGRCGRNGANRWGTLLGTGAQHMRTHPPAGDRRDVLAHDAMNCCSLNSI
jgi:hypothetical protein